MGEWKYVQLENIVESPITYGVVKPGPEDFDGPRLVRGGDITRGKISQNLRTIKNEISRQYKRTILKGGEILVSLVGNPGEVAIAPKSLKGANLARQVGLVRLSDKVFRDYVLYYLMSPLGKNELNSFIMGSVQQVLNLKDLKQVKIALPDMGEQKAIAEVLSSLDDKIDLLHRQNQTLEALAETLFRHHFIDNADEGWEEKPLDDLLTVKGGTTPSTKKPEFWDGDILWTTPRDLSNSSNVFLLDTARKITTEGLSTISSGLLPAGTLLLSSRAPVGYLAFSVYPIAINQGYIAIIDDKVLSKEFIYFWLKTQMDYIKSHANGSTFEEISKTAFKRLTMQLPPEHLRANFQKFVIPKLEKIKQNTFQIRTLETLRDALLPKLMSGTLRVQYEETA